MRERETMLLPPKPSCPQPRAASITSPHDSSSLRTAHLFLAPAPIKQPSPRIQLPPRPLGLGTLVTSPPIVPPAQKVLISSYQYIVMDSPFGFSDLHLHDFFFFFNKTSTRNTWRVCCFLTHPSCISVTELIFSSFTSYLFLSH